MLENRPSKTKKAVFNLLNSNKIFTRDWSHDQLGFTSFTINKYRNDKVSGIVTRPLCLVESHTLDAA